MTKSFVRNRFEGYSGKWVGYNDIYIRHGVSYTL